MGLHPSPNVLKTLGSTLCTLARSADVTNYERLSEPDRSSWTVLAHLMVTCQIGAHELHRLHRLGLLGTGRAHSFVKALDAPKVPSEG